MALNVFETVTSKAGEAGLPFLVIGGYAVMAHGFVRSTEDPDLLVQTSRRAQWRELLEGAGLMVHHDGGTFLQFNAPPWGRLPVDLMLVADDVFGPLQLKAAKAKFEGVEVGVVSLIQLIALKCHAIRNSDKKLRRLKDADDLIQLIQRNGLSLQEPEPRATRCSSMETRNSMISCNAPALQSEGAWHDARALEFPDWSGMQPHEVTMTFAEACRWNEELLAMFPPRPDSAERRAKARCHVEFVI